MSSYVTSIGPQSVSGKQHYQVGAFAAIIPATGVVSSGQVGEQANVVNLTNRMIIIQYITTNPGLYMRELSEDLAIPMGVIQYHIWTLVKEGQVEDYRDGRYRRFFAPGTFQEMDKKVISLLRQETAGKMLALLAHGNPISHKELAAMLGISSQALSWHITRLSPAGIVKTTMHSFGKSYILFDDASRIVTQFLGPLLVTASNF